MPIRIVGLIKLWATEGLGWLSLSREGKTTVIMEKRWWKVYFYSKILAYSHQTGERYG
jgi:hypothetical protein